MVYLIKFLHKNCTENVKGTESVPKLTKKNHNSNQQRLIDFFEKCWKSQDDLYKNMVIGNVWCKCLLWLWLQCQHYWTICLFQGIEIKVHFLTCKTYSGNWNHSGLLPFYYERSIIRSNVLRTCQHSHYMLISIYSSNESKLFPQSIYIKLCQYVHATN